MDRLARQQIAQIRDGSMFSGGVLVVIKVVENKKKIVGTETPGQNSTGWSLNSQYSAGFMADLFEATGVLRPVTLPGSVIADGAPGWQVAIRNDPGKSAGDRRSARRRNGYAEY